MKKSLLCLLFCITNLIVFSQEKIKWKQVNIDDFNTDYKLEYPQAHAIILKEAGDYYFDEWREELRLFYHIRRRIKILDTLGLKNAIIEIPYVAAEHTEDFVKITGFTYNLVNGKIKKTRLRKRYIKTVKISSNLFKKVLKFPKVKPGSIIEVDYILTSLNIIKLRPWYFQHYDMPTLYSSFSFNLPYFIKYRFEIKGQKKLLYARKEDSYTHISYIFHYNDPIPPGLGHYPANFTTTVNFDLQSYLFSYAMQDVEPYKNLPYTDAPVNYIYSIDFDLVQITQKIGYYSPFQQFVWEDFTRRLYQTTEYVYRVISKQESQFIMYPPGFIVYNITDWNDLNFKLLRDEAFGLQLTRIWNVNKLLSSIISEKDKPLKKIIAIYDYVRNNYRWNGIYGVFTTDNLPKIAAIKRGNSADINFSLIYLLRKAGLNAYPVLIKTVGRGHIKKDLPSVYQFNNVVCAVAYQGGYIILDAIDKNRPWFILNADDLNGEGYLVDPIKKGWIPISHPVKPKASLDVKIDLQNDSLQYNIVSTFVGKYILDSITDWISMHLVKISDKFINDYTRQLTFKQSLPDTTAAHSVRIIYPMTLFRLYNPFKSAYRSIPVYFASPYQLSIKVSVSIPQGYLLTSMPKSFSENTDGMRLVFRSDYDTSYVYLSFDLFVDKDFFSPSEYVNLRNIFEKMEGLREVSLVFIKN